MIYIGLSLTPISAQKVLQKSSLEPRVSTEKIKNLL